MMNSINDMLYADAYAGNWFNHGTGREGIQLSFPVVLDEDTGTYFQYVDVAFYNFDDGTMIVANSKFDSDKAIQDLDLAMRTGNGNIVTGKGNISLNKHGTNDYVTFQADFGDNGFSKNFTVRMANFVHDSRNPEPGPVPEPPTPPVEPDPDPVEPLPSGSLDELFGRALESRDNHSGFIDLTRTKAFNFDLDRDFSLSLEIVSQSGNVANRELRYDIVNPEGDVVAQGSGINYVRDVLMEKDDRYILRVWTKDESKGRLRINFSYR